MLFSRRNRYAADERMQGHIARMLSLIMMHTQGSSARYMTLNVEPGVLNANNGIVSVLIIIDS